MTDTITIEFLRQARESENHVEFKAAQGGNYSYNGGSKPLPKDRRHCILGYVVALANENGGQLVFGMADQHPHAVVGTQQNMNGCGQLEQQIYRDLRIRVETSELYEEGKRVLVVTVPSRPVGKVFKFEDVALMRVGEELLPMSDEQYLKIIQEQEPDFSKLIVAGLTFDDLDPLAVRRLKEGYTEKQKNSLFLTTTDKQALLDLDLITPTDDVTYAALLLVGRQKTIRKYLPQAGVYTEYRAEQTQITFDERRFLQGPYLLLVDEIWDVVNLRNGKVPVQQGPRIFDVEFFNQEVIREAIHNAISHRDYRRTSEVVIKQSPIGLHIISPGGFPHGVNIQNLLTVASTPRNRLLAEVMAKTGLVERAGQGIDKIFYQSASEAKPEPDYTASDDFQVELKLSAVVEDKTFVLFIRYIQQDRLAKNQDRLSVQEVITLNKIRRGEPKESLPKSFVISLLDQGLIEKVGMTNRQSYRLSRNYYSLINREGEYTNADSVDELHATMLIMKHLTDFGQAQMGDFVSFLDRFMSRGQIKRLVYRLVEQGTLFQHKAQNQKNTTYRISEKTLLDQQVMGRAVQLGIEEMRKRGEIIETGQKPDRNRTET